MVSADLLSNIDKISRHCKRALFTIGIPDVGLGFPEASNRDSLGM